MADFDSSLPVRTENPGDVIVKVGDGTTPSQQLAIDAAGLVGAKLNDGAGTAITSQVNGSQQALDVGINVAGVQVDPRDTRALTSADVVTANQGAANTAANGWPVKPTDGTNSQVFTASGEANVSVTQPLPAGSNTIGAVTQASGPWTENLTQVGGAAIALGQHAMSASLPVTIASDQSAIPVVITSSLPGTEVNDYNTASAVAAGSTSNHDYAITSSKTFKGKMFWASSSGKLKVEIQTSPDGTTFSTKWVGFNSAATPNIAVQLDMLTITDTGAGSTIRIIRTNRDVQAQDVYSTISGNEI